MTRALVIKELREATAILVVAILAAAWVVASFTGFRLLPMVSVAGGAVPFVNDAIVFSAIFVVGGGLAVALGLKQSAWESRAGTAYFLLHRPLAWSRIIGTKLAVGLALTLIIPAAVIVLYALWAARPGTHADPFYWSMTRECWQAWAALPIVYLGAFASGVRPARWFGTRLAPLVLAIAAAICAGAFRPWWISLPIAAIGAALLVATIIDAVRTRDW